jgi:hypothetical protein
MARADTGPYLLGLDMLISTAWLQTATIALSPTPGVVSPSDDTTSADEVSYSTGDLIDLHVVDWPHAIPPSERPRQPVPVAPSPPATAPADAPADMPRGPPPLTITTSASTSPADAASTEAVGHTILALAVWQRAAHSWAWNSATLAPQPYHTFPLPTDAQGIPWTLTASDVDRLFVAPFLSLALSLSRSLYSLSLILNVSLIVCVSANLLVAVDGVALGLLTLPFALYCDFFVVSSVLRLCFAV